MSAKAGGIPRYRRFEGPALLRQGFRPIFLAAGIWALAAMALWIGVLGGGFLLPSAFDPIAWHAHEMLFGFVVAAIAGFMLTTIPNWTGRMPPQGAPPGYPGRDLGHRPPCGLHLGMDWRRDRRRPRPCVPDGPARRRPA